MLPLHDLWGYKRVLVAQAWRVKFAFSSPPPLLRCWHFPEAGSHSGTGDAEVRTQITTISEPQSVVGFNGVHAFILHGEY